ncbi:hypothetical protein MKW92_039036 [Papaver armeniacum]|nr:hypothetical protein MKW92_039036 [Papaver armeniacum]
MLTGAIPSCIFNLQSLNNIDLSRNYFQGTVPHLLHLNIDSNTHVSLNLSNNNLHGPLPLSPQNPFTFDLSQNEFSGEISVETGKRLSGAHFISLSGNKLSGSIPSSLCVKVTTYSELNYLDFSNNQLSGTVPYSVGYCISLISLNLARNNFTGNVPNEVEQATELRYLQLNDNSLNGSFPSFIQKIEKLELLNLGNNNFESSIPSYIGSLSGLAILSLRSNKFRGLIPSEITKLNKLIILDLSKNNLSGPIPKSVGNMKMLLSRTTNTLYGNYDQHEDAFIIDVQLQMVIKGMIIQLKHLYGYSSGIDLSSNILEGNIPEEMGLLKGLSTLNLSHNHFSGVIPHSIGNMTGLDSLDLNSNNLSGQIPQSLTSLDSLGYFNISYNNLSGKIPRGSHFDTLSLDGSAFVGNYLLCGFPTEIICANDEEDGILVEEDDDQDDVKERFLFYGVVFLGFGAGFWGLFLILLVRKQKWWFGYWRVVDLVATRIAGFFI